MLRTDERFYYYIKDHLACPPKSIGRRRSSIRITIDEDGEVVSAQDYYPYGEILRGYNTGDVNDRFKFTEKERDVESGTGDIPGYDYFGARYYDSEIGRWLSVDPMSSSRPGLSPYNYCQNNPLVRIDPDGMLDKANSAVGGEEEDNENEYKRGKKQEQSYKTLPSLELGETSWYSIAQDASNSISNLGDAINENGPKVLNAIGFCVFPVAPVATAVLSSISTAWTVKNDLQKENYDDTVISGLTTIVSGSKNEYVRFGAYGVQVLYDAGYFNKSVETQPRIQQQIKGSNIKQQIKNYRNYGHYGF